MGHYDSCYEYENEKRILEATKIKEELVQKLNELSTFIRHNKYALTVPQRFQDSLVDFTNYLK